MSGEDSETLRDGVDLMEQKPDHRTYRCVIAVYNRENRKVSAFRASTVPNRGGVAACANHLNGLGGTLANLLPTGCYQLCVGTHFGKTHTVPTVLRLGKGPGPEHALLVTTLRTKNDGVYRADDLWDKCRPADNIHPGFASSSADFSSLGCMTLPGRFSGSVHSGIWAEFRTTAGFDRPQHSGVRYDFLLTTGMELAAIAARAQEALGDLRRLSHGSMGDEVRALQERIGVSVDGSFGPETKRRYVEVEASFLGGKVTGIYSIVSEKASGFRILQ